MIDNIRKVQLKCIEILDIVDKICRDNNISYSLCGGSVVGAHLYGTCLPWDDDIDLMMTRENYNRFLDIVGNYLPDEYEINNYRFCDNFETTFTKIIHKNSTVVQNCGRVTGVFLDITVYDKVPNGLARDYLNWLWKISQVVSIGKVDNSEIKNKLRNFILSVVPSFKNKARYLKYFQKQIERYSNCKDYGYCEFFGAYCNTLVYDKEIFENYSEIEFENKKYMIVRDYVKYLETRYDRTDFVEPKEKQIAPHYKFVDLELPYKDYLKNIGELE